MRDKHGSVSLPEEDYNAVLDVITGLLSHRTTHDLTNVFRSHLLPLLNASACFYARAGPDFGGPMIIDAVGIPKSDINTLQAYFPHCPLARQMVNHSSPVETYDLDMPKRRLKDSITEFYEAHPACKLRGPSYLDDLRTTLLAIDSSEPSVVIGFHRRKARYEAFTRRERRMVELLRPHLCQAIRATADEDSRDHRVPTSVANQMKPRKPLARISRDLRIVDQNSRFQALFKTQEGDLLDSSLARFLEDRIRETEDASDTRTPTNGANWFCLCPNVYRVELSPGLDDLWLLELNQLNGVCPAFNPVLKQYGLTPKEKEICCRVRQGYDNQEIASQLFISVHTAKTHLKNIYRKLDISNRPRLVSFLNKT